KRKRGRDVPIIGDFLERNDEKLADSREGRGGGGEWSPPHGDKHATHCERDRGEARRKKRATLDFVSRPVVHESQKDIVTGAHVARGHGLTHLYHTDKAGRKLLLLGHAGLGGQNIRIDRVNGLTFAYVSNGLKGGLGDRARTYVRIIDALYRCIPVKEELSDILANFKGNNGTKLQWPLPGRLSVSPLEDDDDCKECNSCIDDNDEWMLDSHAPLAPQGTLAPRDAPFPSPIHRYSLPLFNPPGDPTRLTP
ncbi:hypothetical protein PRIPAC_90896, partial [Pristionchus pacificus]|uniref:Uncharacterized protein n=1 Tax=Pristionchus pacificus TaxID=54126 RepID=A0A2A6CZ07_PRIPA